MRLTGIVFSKQLFTAMRRSNKMSTMANGNGDNVRRAESSRPVYRSGRSTGIREILATGWKTENRLRYLWSNRTRYSLVTGDTQAPIEISSSIVFIIHGDSAPRSPFC